MNKMCFKFYAVARPLVTAIVFTLLLNGCEKPTPIWSEEARSQDGIWLATANTVAFSGFGAGVIETAVTVQKKGSSDVFTVLGFNNDGASMALRMEWLTPSHLEVTFNSDPTNLYYQVVKTSGIEISVRNLKSEPAR